jgi:hypothetical protein
MTFEAHISQPVQSPVTEEETKPDPQRKMTK